MADYIDRQAAIEELCAVCGKACDKSKFVYNAPQYEQVILCPEHYCLCTLPSAQPEHLHTVMEKIGKRYEKAMNTPCIKNPMAWALYETWKEYDR